MNCGLMPASAHTKESPPIIPDGTPITVCPGYTTTLPDVIDVTHQFAHWENGSLGHVCPNGVPKPLLVALNMFKNAGENRAAYRMREAEANRKRGGGGG